VTVWIFKGDNGKYLHDYKVGLYGRIEDAKWTEFQMLAHRFTNRNVASVVVEKIGTAGSIKTLTASGSNKRLDAIERMSRETRMTANKTFESLGAFISGAMGQASPSERTGDDK
jgi:hypothetical protein